MDLYTFNMAIRKLAGILYSFIFISVAFFSFRADGATFFEDFERGPSSHGWFALGKRSTFTWNDKGGWIDASPTNKTTRFVRQTGARLTGKEPFFFAYDIMVVGENKDNGFYRGIMSPVGTFFNNFVGSISNNDQQPASIVAKTGSKPQSATAKTIPKPYIVRIEGNYRPEGDQGILTVKTLDLLDKNKEVSVSEIKFKQSTVDFSKLNLFGIGCRANKGDKPQFVKYDNFYFSTDRQNPNPVMPSFISCDLVNVGNVDIITSETNIKLTINIDSIIDSENITVKGSLLPNKKLTGDEIWEGEFGTINLKKKAKNSLTYTIPDLEPNIWTPESPELYVLKIGAYKDDKVLASKEIRFGFKNFKTADGKFILNDKPIFLRGCALNPPAKNVLQKIGQRKDFIKDYIRDLKLRNINIMRMHSQNYDDLKNWLDVCDEMGMMVIQGCYGPPPGAKKDSPSNDISFTINELKDKYFRNFLHHPSVVIYIVANEVGLKQADQRNYYDWLQRVCKKLKAWNPNALYLADAGAPECDAGDINDMHFYAGWYYGSFLDYLNFRKPVDDVTDPQRPLTLSECVGAFTTVKNGFPVMQHQTAPALCWGGNKYGDSKFALQYQAFLTKQSVEQFRRFREYNQRLAGIMPYSLLYSKWKRVRIFSEMDPKPAADQLRVAFQPILLSWENWTPNKYAGQELKTKIHIINDSDDHSDLMRATIYWELTNNSGKKFMNGKVSVPRINYYQSKSFPITIKLPASLEPGGYRLIGNLKIGTKLISSNETKVFVGTRKWAVDNGKFSNSLRLFDPSGEYIDALESINIKFAEIKNFAGLRPGNTLLIGADAESGLKNARNYIDSFVKKGGVIILLAPSDAQLKAVGLDNILNIIDLKSAGVFINRASSDPILYNGLPDYAFYYWSDPNEWDETQPGIPNVAPVKQGFRLNTHKLQNKFIIHANFGRGLQDIALIQISSGNGSYIVSGFDFLSKVGIDPIADKFMANLFSFTASKKKKVIYPSVKGYIKWGDYKSENGIVPSPIYGLLLHGTKSRTVNILGNEYLSSGRIIAGPYRFNSSNEAFMLGGNNTPGTAQFFITKPKGMNYMVSVVYNPCDKEQTLTININGKSPAKVKIAPRQTIRQRYRIPTGTDQLRIFLQGSNRKLILKETRFTR